MSVVLYYAITHAENFSFLFDRNLFSVLFDHNLSSFLFDRDFFSFLFYRDLSTFLFYHNLPSLLSLSLRFLISTCKSLKLMGSHMKFSLHV